MPEFEDNTDLAKAKRRIAKVLDAELDELDYFEALSLLDDLEKDMRARYCELENDAIEEVDVLPLVR
jgi:hypothetical protein